MAPGGSERVIGRYGSDPGPLLLCIGGVHGNEPSGVLAARRVLATLERKRPAFRGRWIALAGNLSAMAAGRRFISDDLNRIWIPENLATVLSTPFDELRDEAREQIELLKAFQAAIGTSRRVHIVDMHSTSADGVPFASVEDTLRNREFAFRFPVPIILGMEEKVSGAFVEYASSLGHTCMTYEGGQHNSQEAIDHHESMIWLALEAAGNVTRRDVPEIEEHEQVLKERCRDLPRALEIRYRHGLGSGDRFRMDPGFQNFDPIEPGQILAHDRNGPIKTALGGRILMPLYQQQGEDGYFVTREFSRFWLHLSALMRRSRLDRLVRFLPGVRRHPSREGWMIVNPGIARWFTVEIFHLLGFRRHQPEGPDLMFSRRRFDW